MKKITFLFMLLTVSIGYSQTNLEDFEGDAPTTTNDQNIANSVEPNPDTSNAINTSATALQLITTTAGEPWQGTKLLMQNNKIDMTTSDKTMTVDVYSLNPVEFLFKLSNSDTDPGGTDPNVESKTAAAHTGSGWETLTLDFNVAADTTQPGYNPPDDQFSAIVFFPLYSISGNGWNPSAVTTTYVDNISGVAGDAIVVDPCTNGVQDGDETGVDCGGSCPNACPSVPTVAAPTPPNRTPANVISIFSDAYNDISVDTFDTPWCPGTTTEVMIEGNPTKLVTGLGCEGVEFVTGRFDATGFGFFHMDIWTDADTMDKSFNFKFSDWNGTGGEVGAFEYSMTNGSSPVALPNPNPGTWISIDLQLSDFTVINGVTGSDFVQFVITSDLGTVYYDNLYLHNNNLSTDEFAINKFKVFPNPTADNWTISGNNPINSVTVYDILGKQVSALTSNANEVEISTRNLNSGIYFARIESVNGTETVKLIKE
nr:T9SS type A sorting domain-containing protein [uncultured Psychroserpens sp.]